jgi:hypothetical protein
MKRRIALLISLVLLFACVGPAHAGKKKAKPKPKPYTSEKGIIAAPHTLLFASTGEMNSVTAREFENTCAIPATNGVDAYVYQVPEEYTKIPAQIAAHSDAMVAWDLYTFFYEEDCTRHPYALQATGSVTMHDTEGEMPAGTYWVLIANFAGDPAMVYYELKP